LAGIKAVVAGGAIPLTLALPALLTALPALADPPAMLSDADIVFCLSADQRAPLADAAVALGLAAPAGRPGELSVNNAPVSVQRWRELRGADFVRACTALVAAREGTAAAAKAAPPNEDGAGAKLLDLLPVALGALLTGVTALVGSWWKDNIGARRGLAADLAAAIRVLGVALERVIASGEVTADQQPARLAAQQAYTDALSAVRRVLIAYPGQPQPAALQERLTAGGFAADLTGWYGDPGERAARATRLRTRLAEIDELTDRIAAALQRRARPRVPATGRPVKAPTT
jgi:hypothetical protein